MNEILSEFTICKDELLRLNKSKNNLENLDQEFTEKIEKIFQQIKELNFKSAPEILFCIKNEIKPQIKSVKSEIKSKKHFILFDTKEKKLEQQSLESAFSILKSVKRRLDSIKLEGVSSSVYNENSTTLEKIRNFFTRMLLLIGGNISYSINSRLFPSWNVPLENRKLESQKYVRLISELIEKNKGQLKNLLTEYLKENSKGEAASQEKLKIIQEERDKLTRLIEEYKKIVVDLSKEIEDREKNNKASLLTKINMQRIGGEIVRIFDSKSNSTLDGMYLSADEFRFKLKEAGAKVVLFPGEKKSFSGFCFPKEKFENSLIKEAFDNLHIEKCGGKFFEREGKIYLFFQEDFEKLQDLFVTEAYFTLEEKEIDLTKKAEGGTVVFTTGFLEVYEMHKREIMTFLMQGMNVMACNFSGYGESTGTPNGEVFKRNLRAVYSHLQKFHPVKDENIVVKALCMGGGPAAYLAAEHPKMNLLLDQSYADFKEVVARHIHTKIKNDFNTQGNKMTQVVAHVLAYLISPHWKTCDVISKIEGRIGLLLSKDDTVMTIDQDAYHNVKAAVKTKKYAALSVATMPGSHGSYWIDHKEGRKAVFSFLEAANLKGQLS